MRVKTRIDEVKSALESSTFAAFFVVEKSYSLMRPVFNENFDFMWPRDKYLGSTKILLCVSLINLLFSTFHQQIQLWTCGRIANLLCIVNKSQ